LQLSVLTLIELGKRRRLSRIFGNGKRILIVPMEFGTAFAPNDWDLCAETTRAVMDGGADAIMTTYGQARQFSDHLLNAPLILTINYGWSDLAYPLEYVREANLMGADAVKVHFFGPLADMPLLELQRLSAECKSQGMPFLFEPIPMTNYPNSGGQQLLDPIIVKKAVDLGVIIGADIIKIAYPGSAESLSKVTRGCPVPVVIAGGSSLSSDTQVLDMIRGAMDGGASGGAIGRNITTHRNPMKITKAISMIVHDDASVKDALKVLA